MDKQANVNSVQEVSGSISCDNNIRYASAGKYIIKLELLPKSKINETRSTVADVDCAVFRTNTAKVVSIKDKITFETAKSCVSDVDSQFMFFQTCVVKNDIKSIDDDPLFKSGIYYYKTLKPAFHLNLIKFVPNYTGKWFKFDAEGNKVCEINYENGCKHGTYLEWVLGSHGKLIQSVKCNYMHNMLSGEYVSYFNTGRKHIHSTYKNDKLCFAYREYFKNQNIKIFCFYLDNNLNGMYREWRENGILYKSITYKNGLKHGCEEIYDKDGVKNVGGKYTYYEGAILF